MLEMAAMFIEAGFPPGVVNVVTGFGQEVGEPLVTHPDVAHVGFTGGDAAGRRIYALALSSVLVHRARFATLFMAFCLLSCLLYPFLGRDFFPSVDAGQIRLHMRAPTGTRIEDTARIADAVEAADRKSVV